MNCQEFWETMPEFESDANPASTAHQEHQEQCPACAARLQSQRALTAGLRALAVHMMRTEAPSRVEGRLRTAFRVHYGLPGYRPANRRWATILTWAGAAAAVIALAMLLVRIREPEPPLLLATHGVELAMMMPADTETADDTTVAENGFIPLPNAARIDPDEDLNLVRVEVPRSAMIALGFEIRPEEASETVQADVMLGSDGLARAVHFLD